MKDEELRELLARDDGTEAALSAIHYACSPDRITALLDRVQRLAQLEVAARELLRSARATHRGFSDQPEYSADRIIAELGPALDALDTTETSQ